MRSFSFSQPVCDSNDAQISHLFIGALRSLNARGWSPIGLKQENQRARRHVEFHNFFEGPQFRTIYSGLVSKVALWDRAARLARWKRQRAHKNEVWVVKTAIAFIVSVALPVLARADTWQIDPVHTNVEFTIRHMMISDVKGQFQKTSGTISVNGNDPTSAAKLTQPSTLRRSTRALRGAIRI